jgi:hypothetical protein
LRIASEGEKTASDPIIVESNTPSYNFTNLETKWYDIKVQAIADTSNTHYIDSEWSESDSIDLHWANLEILPPSGLTISSAGEKLTISWDPVANAEHYSVDVFVPGYPPIYVTQNVETVSTKITIAVPELGEYAASVTAYGPFGKVKGDMSTLTTEVKMGKVENLAIKEISPESFTATWSQVAFAEGYEVKVLELSGNATIFNTDYSSMPEVLKDNANNTWEMAQYFYDGSGTFNSSRITFQHPTTWIASCEYQEEVTKVEYSFYYGGTPTDDFGEDTFLLEGLVTHCRDILDLGSDKALSCMEYVCGIVGILNNLSVVIVGFDNLILDYVSVLVNDFERACLPFCRNFHTKADCFASLEGCGVENNDSRIVSAE